LAPRKTTKFKGDVHFHIEISEKRDFLTITAGSGNGDKASVRAIQLLMDFFPAHVAGKGFVKGGAVNRVMFKKRQKNEE